MGAGGAFFLLNVDGLAKFSTVYLIDLPGNTIHPDFILQVLTSINIKFSIVCTWYIIYFQFVGFGKSSRNKFSKNLEKCEEEYALAIEKWREKMDLESINICGHSFGGYISSLYALRYPQR